MQICLRDSALCGATRNRTGDTRIFSPLLYQLSYGTVKAGANVIKAGHRPQVNDFFPRFFLEFFGVPLAIPSANRFQTITGRRRGKSLMPHFPDVISKSQ